MIGLSLGILTTQMFSIIIMVAVITSFLAPLGLRLTMPRVRMTEDEAHRILASESTGAFDPQRVRVLLAAGGGANALAAAPLAYGIASKSASAVRIVNVQAKRSWWQRLLRPFHPPVPGNAADQLETMRSMAPGKPPEVGQTSGSSITRAICDEARRGYDLVVMGSGPGPSVGGAAVEDVVADAPCHVAIMKAAAPATEYRHILVPVDGSVASRMAVELALRYAEGAGADLALAVLVERRPGAAGYGDGNGSGNGPTGNGVPTAPAAGEAAGATSDEELQRISVAFRASDIKPNILHLAFDPRSSAISQEVERGHYDLVVLGAENRAIQHRLFFGYENERLIRGTRIPVVVVVPNLSRLGGSA
jgi:nucleotide-binding universal stress UspA family protein